MKKLIFQLIFVILLCGLGSVAAIGSSESASDCQIATHSISIGNGTLSYNQVGTDEKPIFLLHGLFASKEQWNSMMCQLSEEGKSAIAPDLPGYGDSRGFAIKDYALENQVTLLHQLIEQLEISTLDLAGSSMGGTIAFLYSQRYPQQSRSVAFIGSPLGVVDWSSSVKNSILDGINPFIPVTKEQFDLEINLLFVTPPTIPDSIKIEKVKDYNTRNLHYQKIWNIANLYDRVLCQKKVTQIPTLAIWGRQDEIYNIRGVDRLQSCIPQSQTIQLPKAGHLLLMENSEEAIAHYLKFLAALSS